MDAERLGLLIDRHADALELFARQRCDAAEDVVQEAFVSLAGLAVEPENPAAWLFRVVRNGAINAATADRRRQRRESEAASRMPPWFEPSDDPDAIDPRAAEIELRALPIDQREAIVAHLWGGLTFAQIGTMTGRSSSAAHRLYHAGLNTLRERLGVPCPNRNARMTRD